MIVVVWWRTTTAKQASTQAMVVSVKLLVFAQDFTCLSHCGAYIHPGRDADDIDGAMQNVDAITTMRTVGSLRGTVAIVRGAAERSTDS
jgi:hypothetical protein